MRMPGMDGAQLLDLVKVKFPRTVRIILSGQSDRETILRSVGPSHQYLSKPCDLDELKQRLMRAFALRDMLNDTHLKEVIGRLKTVPSLPALYVAVTEALRSSDSSITEIGNLIAQDMGMSAKVLQLVNSAFFGLSNRVSSPQQAVLPDRNRKSESAGSQRASVLRFGRPSHSGLGLLVGPQHEHRQFRQGHCPGRTVFSAE